MERLRSTPDLLLPQQRQLHFPVRPIMVALITRQNPTNHITTLAAVANAMNPVIMIPSLRVESAKQMVNRCHIVWLRPSVNCQQASVLPAPKATRVTPPHALSLLSVALGHVNSSLDDHCFRAILYAAGLDHLRANARHSGE